MSVDPGAVLYDPDIKADEPTALEALLTLLGFLAARGPFRCNTPPGKRVRIQDLIDEDIETFSAIFGGSLEISNSLSAYEDANIKAIAAANGTFLELCEWPSNPILHHCFCQIAPVLILWRQAIDAADWPRFALPSSRERAHAGTVRQWLRGLPWQSIINEAAHRDAAAAELMAGRAVSSDGAVFAAPSREAFNAG